MLGSVRTCARNVLRPIVARGRAGYLRAVVSTPGPERLRGVLLRAVLVEVASSARIGRGVDFTNRNVRVGRGARVGDGTSFRGMARIEILDGAATVAGSVVDTATILDGTQIVIHHPLVVDGSGVRERGV